MRGYHLIAQETKIGSLVACGAEPRVGPVYPQITILVGKWWSKRWMEWGSLFSDNSLWGWDIFFVWIWQISTEFEMVLVIWLVNIWFFGYPCWPRINFSAVWSSAILHAFLLISNTSSRAKGVSFLSVGYHWFFSWTLYRNAVPLGHTGQSGLGSDTWIMIFFFRQNPSRCWQALFLFL